MIVRIVLLAAALVLSAGPASSARQRAFETRALTALGAAAASTHLEVQAMVAAGRLQPVRFHEDTLLQGRFHERLAQRHMGVPVFGSEIVRQIDGSTVRTVFGRTFENITIEPTPALSGAEAQRRATAGLTASAVEVPELGVLPLDGRYALAWRVPVRSARNVEDVYVDAGSGAILRRRSRIRSQLGDIGLGHGVFGDVKKVAARRGAGGFEAHDAVRPGRIETYDFAGSLARLLAFLQTLALPQEDLARDADNTWDDGAVVDAHVHQGFTYDYFFKRFGRRGMDDANGTVTTIVHPLARAQDSQLDEETVGLFINNAFQLGGTRILVFGDGDGRAFDYTAAGLDVVAHEWTHGVTEHGSGLLYEDEPGALNESFSDIMGAAVEFMFHEPGSGLQRADWVLGEDIFKLGPYLRSMSDPVSVGHPDHYSLRRFIGTPVDNGGVHINSSISNHAFYLAVVGGRNRVSGMTVRGIGFPNIERMERVFYRAFIYFLTPRSGFADARRATLVAAQELYGPMSPEFLELAQAWTAVGVH